MRNKKNYLNLSKNVKGYLLPLLPFLFFSQKAVSSDEMYLNPFVGLNTGYQFSQDEAHDNRDPSGGMAGFYSGIYLSENINFRLGFQHHSELYAEDTKRSAIATIFEAAAHYEYPIFDRYNLFFGGGFAYAHVTNKDNRNASQFNDMEFSPLIRLGVSYKFNRNFILSTEYQYIDSLGGVNGGEYDSHGLVFSLTYNFYRESKLNNNEDSDYLFPPKSLSEKKPVVRNNILIMNEPRINQKFETIYFGLNEKESPNVHRLMSVVSDLKNNEKSTLEITGHTDSLGSRAYNQILSKERAVFVEKYFINNGISSERISISWEGELNPIASNKTEAGRAKNRRVKVKFESKK